MRKESHGGSHRPSLLNQSETDRVGAGGQQGPLGLLYTCSSVFFSREALTHPAPQQSSSEGSM